MPNKVILFNDIVNEFLDYKVKHDKKYIKMLVKLFKKVSRFLRNKWYIS